MAAVLVEYLPDGKEPVSVDEVKHNSRIDGDADDQFIETVLIPAARQLAETRAGAAIRPARYRDLLPSLASFPLSLSQVREIDSVVVDGESLPDSAYSLIELGKQTLIDVPEYRGRGGLITYQAGIEDMSAYPFRPGWRDAWVHPAPGQILDAQIEIAFDHRRPTSTLSISVSNAPSTAPPTSSSTPSKAGRKNGSAA